mgnify:CR=1 FL=1
MDKALELYRAAYDQHYPDGACTLGLCYESGVGVEEDKVRAVELYREAADQGFPPAQCNLGPYPRRSGRA